VTRKRDSDRVQRLGQEKGDQGGLMSAPLAAAREIGRHRQTQRDRERQRRRETQRDAERQRCRETGTDAERQRR
jgi:hypothetical protein